MTPRFAPASAAQRRNSNEVRIARAPGPIDMARGRPGGHATCTLFRKGVRRNGLPFTADEKRVMDRHSERQICNRPVEFRRVIDGSVWSGQAHDLTEFGIGLLTPTSVEQGTLL